MVCSILCLQEGTRGLRFVRPTSAVGMLPMPCMYEAVDVSMKTVCSESL